MKISSLIQIMAEATGVEKATVTNTARFLREAGYLTSTGARGVNGPDMVPRDAARVLIALLGTGSPVKAVETYEALCKTIPGTDAAGAEEEVTAQGLPCSNGETIEEALTQAIGGQGIILDDLRIECDGHSFTCTAWGAPVYFLPDYSELQGVDLKKLFDELPHRPKDTNPTAEEFELFRQEKLKRKLGILTSRAILGAVLLFLREKFEHPQT